MAGRSEIAIKESLKNDRIGAVIKYPALCAYVTVSEERRKLVNAQKQTGLLVAESCAAEVFTVVAQQ